MKIKGATTFLILSSCLCSSYAVADVANVVGGTIDAGNSHVEWRSAIDRDEEHGDVYIQRQHIAHSFNEWLELRAVAVQRRVEGRDLAHLFTTFEATFQTIESEEYGWDSVFRIGYDRGDGAHANDRINLVFAAEKQIDEWNLRANTFFSHEVGDDANDGLGMQFRWRAVHTLPQNTLKSAKLGLEMFSNLGRLNNQSGYNNQRHTIGPVLHGKATDSIGYLVGHQFGISDTAPDHALKVFLIQNF